MKVKDSKFSIIRKPEQQQNFYSLFLDFVYKSKPYCFILMCIYYVSSFGLYYLKAPSSVSSFIEYIAFFILVCIGVSAYDSISKIRGVDELKVHLSQYDDFTPERKNIINNYYKAMIAIYVKRTLFDEYWYYALIFPVVLLLCFGWFDTIFVLYIAIIAFHKHFMDNEVEAIERIKHVVDKPSL